MSKAADVMLALRQSWADTNSLLDMTGWKPHTLRAVISTHARKANLKVERKREAGVTSYRVTEQLEPTDSSDIIKPSITPVSAEQ